jgi:hypothetical protein
MLNHLLPNITLKKELKLQNIRVILQVVSLWGIKGGHSVHDLYTVKKV